MAKQLLLSTVIVVPITNYKKVVHNASRARSKKFFDRSAELYDIFVIEAGAYVVMSNHYLVVLRVNKQNASDRSDLEFIAREEKLFSLPLSVQSWQNEKITLAEAEVVKKLLANGKSD